jgi:hypothetical protein
MPRVHTKTKSRAGREYQCGRCGETIRPGEKYFSWSFRYGGTQVRCYRHPPRQSELTQSNMSAVYAAIEDATYQLPDVETIEDIMNIVQDDVANVVQEVADEYAEAADAMGAAGESGESRERAADLESWATELQSWEPDVDPTDADDARLEAEIRWVYEQLPPDVQEVRAPNGVEDIPVDPIERSKLMDELEMDREVFDAFMEETMAEWYATHGDPLEDAREQAESVLGDCPF